MKVCFVILAHHQPQIFRRLIRNISWENSDVVVHLDERSDINEYSITGFDNLHFVKSRKTVNRCGWTLTKTMCEALGYGLEVSDAQYFMYLAGTDFPICRMETIMRFLSEHYPANFINWCPVVPGSTWSYGLIDRYYFNDLKSCFMNLRGLEKYRVHNDYRISRVRRILGTFVIKAEDMFNARLPKKNVTWTNFYHGSTRWCLNRDTVRFVVEYYRSKESRKLCNFLRLCANSDEIFFQTVILNSQHKEQCVMFDESAAKETFEGKRPHMSASGVFFHYIDWSPKREDPAILVESDFQSLKDSGKFFACKFMDNKSLGLVELVERELLGARFG